MHLLELFQKEIISFASALILAGVLYQFRARAKLVWATAHGFTFLLPTASVASPQSPGQQTMLPANVPPNFNIHTGSLVVLNTGRIPATEVEVTFNWQPPNYNIWPVRPHETHTSPDSRFTLKFANLAPKEQFLVEQISPQPLPQIMFSPPCYVQSFCLRQMRHSPHTSVCVSCAGEGRVVGYPIKWDCLDG
jgi:hypothetical protein